jgi:arylsulfatase A-like enzyme
MGDIYMHIIIYVLDSLRADHLGCYGYERATSAHIDQLAQDGILFENCYTVSTWTRPVAASLLSGTYPIVHGVQGGHDVFSSSVPRLPKILQENGFLTSCISAIGNVSTQTGFGKGFDYFCDLFMQPDNLLRSQVKSSGRMERLGIDEDIILPFAEDINNFLFPWLDKHLDDDTFVLLWSMQPHAPYDPPKKFCKFVSDHYDGRYAGRRDMTRVVKTELDRKYLIDLYDSEIYYNDHCIGELISYLKRTDQYDETLLIILSDHGDAFGEHGTYAHGHIPLEAVIHVPLIIKLPEQKHSSRRIHQLVSLVDILPSINDYLGLPADIGQETETMGKSVFPLIHRSMRKIHQYVFTETRLSTLKPSFYSINSDEWKYIKTIPGEKKLINIGEVISRLFKERIIFSILKNPAWLFKRYLSISSEMLYHLTQDPHEEENLVRKKKDILSSLKKEMEVWQKKCKKVSYEYKDEFLQRDESEVLREHLKALGYLD